jgi:hypothetical protein
MPGQIWPCPMSLWSAMVVGSALPCRDQLTACMPYQAMLSGIGGWSRKESPRCPVGPGADRARWSRSWVSDRCLVLGGGGLCLAVFASKDGSANGPD